MIDKGLIREGMTVYSAEGEKLGKVTTCEVNAFVIEKGFFFPKDYVAHFEDVANVQGDAIRLVLRGDALREIGQGSDIRGRSGRSEAAPGEEVRVPVAEEELDVSKRIRDAGEVRVHKDVVSDTKRVDVPVMREEVHVERIPTGERQAAPGEGAFERKTVSMPIHEEDIEVNKRPVVKEEVRLRKDRTVEQRAAEGEVRREDVRIEGPHDENAHRSIEEGGDSGGSIGPTLREPGE